jgi:hypothetical protein
MPILVPAVGFRGEVSLGKIRFDGVDQFAHMTETSIANGILSQIAEEPFNEVEPRTACGGEVHVEPWVFCQPFPNAVMLVRAVVIGDQVQIKVLWSLAIDLLEKSQPIDVCVLVLGAGDDLSIQIVQCGKQRYGSMPDIVMRLGAHLSDPERQAGLSTFQRLTLAFLVTTQNNGPLWRVSAGTQNQPLVGE